MKRNLLILSAILFILIPPDKSIGFLVEHVFSVQNFIIGLIGYTIYIATRKSKNIDEFLGHRDIHDSFRERVRR
jgi:uncharacterized membrane protein (DUF4010 family)